jgi:hypothetical protein
VTFPLAAQSLLWEIPIMDSIIKLDSRRRGVFPLPFQPGDLLAKVGESSDKITFCIVKPAEVPLVGIMKKEGFSMLKTKPATAEQIASAIRADRNDR